MDWIQISGLVLMVCLGVLAFFVMDFMPWFRKRREAKRSSGDAQSSMNESTKQRPNDPSFTWLDDVPGKQFVVQYRERETLPDRMEEVADELGITVEQLIKRFITSGMQAFEDDGPVVPGKTLEDFFVKNGVLKERK